SRPGGEEALSAFTQAGALTPPYDPETLCLLVVNGSRVPRRSDGHGRDTGRPRSGAWVSVG
ncbi:MAG: hypothetical protein RL199_2405, partial [Pseudomonadota bacterium]